MDYEILIVGGRAAGSSLALLLARQGHHVLVVDRDTFPSDTLSTHFMNPRAVGAVLQQAGGERREVRAHVVVGADGRQSPVAHWAGAEKYLDVPALRPGYYGYYHGVEAPAEPTLEMWFGGDQIGFLFPMRPD